MALPTCSRCGSYLLGTDIPCEVCVAADRLTEDWSVAAREAFFAEQRETNANRHEELQPAAAASVAPPPPISSGPPPPPAAIAEIEDWRQRGTSCPHCGSPLLGRDGETCSTCGTLEQLYGNDPVRLEEKLAEMREMAARSEAEFMAETAGKTEDQWMAEQAALDQFRPEIPSPAVVTSGKAPHERTEAEEAEVKQWIEERRFALPTNVPPLNANLIIRSCVELTAQEGPLDNLAVGFDARGWWWGADQDPEPNWLTVFPWSNLVSIDVDGPETIEERVTLPRAAGFGIFSLGMKKKEARSFLTLHTPGSSRVLEVKNVTAVELRAQMHPITTWLDTYSPTIQAVAA